MHQSGQLLSTHLKKIDTNRYFGFNGCTPPLPINLMVCYSVKHRDKFTFFAVMSTSEFGTYDTAHSTEHFK